MKARVLNFRQGRHTQRTNQLLLSVEGIATRIEAAKLTGRRVVWKTKSGKTIAGKVAGPHGNSGALRARFSKGISGEILGKDIEISE
ncbi:MAG: 50S ribosomal protein L35ae [Candidatus Aenigmarchaeota archaeon]|nr:50S ribosomal protein L35ae [Candidatus Aenigmarchaeota archaeon]